MDDAIFVALWVAGGTCVLVAAWWTASCALGAGERLLRAWSAHEESVHRRREAARRAVMEREFHEAGRAEYEREMKELYKARAPR